MEFFSDKVSVSIKFSNYTTILYLACVKLQTDVHAVTMSDI